MSYLNIFRARWKVVLASLLGGLMLASLLTLFTPKQYESNTSLFISTKESSSDTSSAYQGSLFSEQRVKSYSELFSSTRLASGIRDRLRLSESPEDISRKISAQTQVDSVLINVSVTDTSPEKAQAIAGAAAQTFVDFVAQLEQPPDPTQPAPVTASIVDAASLPITAKSPDLSLNLAVGLILGAAVGAALAILLARLDNRVKTSTQLADLSNAPVLGEVPYIASLEVDRVLNFEDLPATYTEALRQIRTNLRFVDVDRASIVYGVTSSLQSEGKSTFVSSLASALAVSGAKVIVIEADLRRPSLADVQGVTNDVGLSSILAGRITPDLVTRTSSHGVQYIFSGPLPPNPSELLGSRRMEALLAHARTSYDICLIDLPPTLPVTDAVVVSSSCDAMIAACRYDSTSIQQFEAMQSSLEAVGAKLSGVVFTMVPETKRSYGRYEYYGTKTIRPDSTSDADSTSQLRIPARLNSKKGDAVPVRASHREAGAPHRDTESRPTRNSSFNSG